MAFREDVPFPLGLLPNELLSMIAVHLSPIDSFSLSKVFQRFRCLTIEDGARYSHATDTCVDFPKQLLAFRLPRTASWCMVLNDTLDCNKTRFEWDRSLFLTKTFIREQEPRAPDHRRTARHNLKDIGAVFFVADGWNKCVDQLLFKLNKDNQEKTYKRFQVFLPDGPIPRSILQFDVKFKELEIKRRDIWLTLPPELIPLIKSVTTKLRVDCVLSYSQLLEIPLPDLHCTINTVDLMIFFENLSNGQFSDKISLWTMLFKGNIRQMYGYFESRFGIDLLSPNAASNHCWILRGFQINLWHPQNLSILKLQ